MTGLQRKPNASAGTRGEVGPSRIEVGVGGQGEFSGVSSAPKRREKERSLDMLDECDRDISLWQRRWAAVSLRWGICCRPTRFGRRGRGGFGETGVGG